MNSKKEEESLYTVSVTRYGPRNQLPAQEAWVVTQIRTLDIPVSNQSRYPSNCIFALT